MNENNTNDLRNGILITEHKKNVTGSEMSYPCVYVYTKVGCGPCIGFMRSFKAFERDILNISPNAKVIVYTVDNDWKTRVQHDYGIPGVDNRSNAPIVDHLEFSPMIAIGRSDEVGDLSKLRVNGGIYKAKNGYFEQGRPEELRGWLNKNLKELSNGGSSSSSSPAPPPPKASAVDEKAEKERVAKILDNIRLQEEERSRKSGSSSSNQNVSRSPPSESKPVFFRLVGLN